MNPSELKRWDIINHFIAKYNCRSYLEIGYFRGWSFDRVNCREKLSVDPNPCKDKSQEAQPYGALLKIAENAFVSKLKSDDFFEKVAGEGVLCDIVFIDGLHEAQQVLKDIENSLKHLTENGIIILHDCNPPTLKHVTTGTDIGEWTGDCYKAIVTSRGSQALDLYVVNTDWGVGVLRRNSQAAPAVSAEDVQKAVSDWNFFDKNRKELLNLITVEEFWKKEAIPSSSTVS